MTIQNFIFFLLSSIFSGIIGVLIANCYHEKQQLEKTKVDLLSDFSGYRYQLTGKYNGKQDEIISSLNRIVIVFSKSDKVISALLSYKASKKTNNLITLIKRMCDDVKIEYSKFNDSLINEPFIGNHL